MATPNIALNPALSTNFEGSFAVQTTGYTQGAYMDDPAQRFNLRGGYLASTETIPMWGGVAITASVPSPASVANALGASITRASGNTTINGFSVFNQGGNLLVTAQSRAPAGGSNAGINYILFGSNLRLAVQCNPTLAAALEGGSYNQQVSWDFVNQELITYASGIGALNVRVLDVNIGNSAIIVYNSGTGFVNWNRSGSCALILI